MGKPLRQGQFVVLCFVLHQHGALPQGTAQESQTGLVGPPRVGGRERNTLLQLLERQPALLHQSHNPTGPHGAVFTALSRQPVPCRRTRRAKQRKRPRKVGKRRASQVGLDSHRADLPTRFTLFINLLRSASLISLFLNTLWFASCIVYFINYSFTYPSIFLCIFRDTFDLLFMYFSVVSN